MPLWHSSNIGWSLLPYNVRKLVPVELSYLQNFSALCPFLLYFFLFPFPWCGSLSREGHPPPMQPTKAAQGWVKKPSLLPSLGWESRGGMSFHASKTTRLNSSSDLFHCGDESFYFFRSYPSLCRLFSPLNLTLLPSPIRFFFFAFLPLLCCSLSINSADHCHGPWNF